jgi:2-oxoglutarate dehydrogenase E2 component (dihydrolipoamide succinyltransferase)
MSVDVVMPQMGESITEGTISKWIKKVGDKIERDEPILEISTDKVDAEVPSPGAGILLAIKHQEGETVEVGTVLAVIGEAGEKGDAETRGRGDVERTVAVAKSEIEQPKTQTVTASQSILTPTQNPKSEISHPNSSDATEVVMPQMGESITEGTISKWLKQVGDTIVRDEPLLEISTDKVDAEVPSPAAGKLLAINYQEGQTVEVGTVLALVGAGGGAITQKKTVDTLSGDVHVRKLVPKSEVAAAARPSAQIHVAPVPATKPNGGSTVEELRRTKSSPLVRNIAKTHGVNLAQISGSGMSGRVTKKDILSFIDSGAALKPQDLLKKSASPISAAPSETRSAAFQPVATVGDRVEKMSVIRKKIAEHMTLSKRISAHVSSVYEIDMTNVVKFRERHKNEFQSRYGTKISFMPFVFQAVTNGLRAFPIINSQVGEDQIIYKADVNLGIAVALDWGLIVPVIKRADQLSLSGLAIAANDLAERARAKKLKPDEVHSGTFTITNPGVFGGLYGMPIINQPQVAILCVGVIEKRPKVITTETGDDYVAIRSMAYFSLTYDHRVVDGADAEKFLAFLKNYLETTQFSL